MNRISRLAATVLVSGVRNGRSRLRRRHRVRRRPYTWCPGDEVGGFGGGFNTPADARPNWNWNACHTYHYVNPGQGNVSSTVWDGDNPPARLRGRRRTCWSLFIPRPC